MKKLSRVSRPRYAKPRFGPMEQLTIELLKKGLEQGASIMEQAYLESARKKNLAGALVCLGLFGCYKFVHAELGQT